MCITHTIATVGIFIFLVLSFLIFPFLVLTFILLNASLNVALSVERSPK